MDHENISRINAAMNVTTQKFLNEFTPKLEKLFHKELSSVYLESMDEHLRTFYNDVLTELENKQSAMSTRIEELFDEANQLKRKLNMEFDFDLNQNDMPLMVYQEKLDSNLAEMREKYEIKMNQIEECIRSQQLLCEELDESIRPLSIDPLASDSEIYDFKNYLVDLKTEKARRLNEIECLRHEIHAICEEIGLDKSELLQTTFGPTMESIKHLQTERDRCQKEKERIHHECEQLLQKLEILWDCLDTPNSIRSKYRITAKQCKFSSVSELNQELKMCKVSKQENLKLFIEKLRKKLIEQWDKIYKSQEERESFEFLQSDTYTDDLLQLHEMELEECTRFYSENKNIFDLFIVRNQWWEKKKALEAKQNEPNRYNNRGGQLLKEEKERKQTDIEIPKVEKKIKALAEDFRRQNNRDFLINGMCIIQLMENEWEAYRGGKELMKSARKAVATPCKVAMTPKTPLRGQTTLKRMASTTNLGMTTGNLAKKRHLDLPSREINRTTSVQKMAAASYLVRSHTKRNLFKQYSDENASEFMKPTAKSIQQKRVISTNKKLLANISANKILKKYRLSSSRRVSSHNGITSDESLINYDVFENHIKTSQISNSSIVGQKNASKEQENMLKILNRGPISKTHSKNNNCRTKSPLKPSNMGVLQANNVDDLV